MVHSVAVVGCTDRYVVIFVSPATTADNRPTPPTLEPWPEEDLGVVRPPLAPPYARTIPRTEPIALHFGKRPVVAWHARRM
jgi:hypothetical protein